MKRAKDSNHEFTNEIGSAFQWLLLTWPNHYYFWTKIQIFSLTLTPNYGHVSENPQRCTEGRNLTIFNIICWVDGTIVGSPKCLMFQVLFFFHDFLQNYFQKSFQFIYFYFCITLQKKIKSFECPKSKPATNLFFISNLSK